MKNIIFTCAKVFICLTFLFSCNIKDKEIKELKQPNILFAIADDASFLHMGAYGCNWVSTPAFDRVAREGLLFMNAYTPNAKCAPSRACILTGRNSWQLEEAANHGAFFPAKFTTYMEALLKNGYHTGHTAKGWAPGNPGEVDGKKRELTGPAFNRFQTTAPTSEINNNDYAANFKDFLDQKPKDKPFSFWYGSTEPHRAYEFRSGIEKGGKKLNDIDKVPSFWPDNDTIRADMLDYAYEIEYFDNHLQRMLDILEERGELENTIIVVTADNGMPFPRVKGQEYEYSNHLPLAIMWPAGIVNPGRKIDDFVSFIDFSATFLEVAQVEEEKVGMQPITGKSLTDILYSDKSGIVNPNRNEVLIGKERHDLGRPNDWGYPIRGIVTEGYIYLHNFEHERWPAGNPETGYLNIDGSPTKTFILNERRESGSKKYWGPSFGKRPVEELYQINRDPECMDNLALHPEYQAVREKLKNGLFNKLREQEDPRMFGNGYIFDEYKNVWTGSNPSFYDSYMKGEEVNAGWVNETDFETGEID